MQEHDMEITPERAEKIKRALIRQYEDQYGVEVIGYTETKDGVAKTTYLRDAKGAPA